jgi:hypothetical protein
MLLMEIPVKSITNHNRLFDTVRLWRNTDDMDLDSRRGAEPQTTEEDMCGNNPDKSGFFRPSRLA